MKGTEKFFKLCLAHTLVAQIDLSSLNEIEMVPKKDYDTNRLSAGALQFLNSTVALFDETQMQEGKTESDRVVRNMQGIASLIEEQKVKYSFQFHNQEFECSCPVVIVSCGRSIFKNAPPLPVYPTKAPNPDVVNDIDSDLLDEFRYFFNQVSRKGRMNISDVCNEHIQAKFVEARQESTPENEVGAHTLHRWLTFTRLKVISQGQEDCQTDIVDYVMDMEKARNKRVAEVLKKDF